MSKHKKGSDRLNWICGRCQVNPAEYVFEWDKRDDSLQTEVHEVMCGDCKERNIKCGSVIGMSMALGFCTFLDTASVTLVLREKIEKLTAIRDLAIGTKAKYNQDKRSRGDVSLFEGMVWDLAGATIQQVTAQIDMLALMLYEEEMEQNG